MENDTLIWHGSAIKATEGVEGGFGGYVVRFGDPQSADTQGQYFTKATDFGLDLTDKGRVIFHHGLDKTIGLKSLAIASLKADDVGIWAQGIIDRRGKYEQAIYGMVKAGVLGWSSGTASHLVRMKPAVKGKTEITHWPLGLDLSVTPSPVDPLTSVGVVSIKSLTLFDNLEPIAEEGLQTVEVDGPAGLKALEASMAKLQADLAALASRPALKAVHLGKHAEKDAALSGMSSLHYAAQSAIHGHMVDEKKSTDEKLSSIKDAMDEHRDLSLKMAKAMLSHKGGDQSGAMKAILDEALAASCSGLRLNAQAEMLRGSIKAYTERLGRIARVREAKGGSVSARSREALKAMVDDLSAVLVATEPKDRQARIKALQIEHLNESATLEELLDSLAV